MSRERKRKRDERRARGDIGVIYQPGVNVRVSESAMRAIDKSIMWGESSRAEISTADLDEMVRGGLLEKIGDVYYASGRFDLNDGPARSMKAWTEEHAHTIANAYRRAVNSGCGEDIGVFVEVDRYEAKPGCVRCNIAARRDLRQLFLNLISPDAAKTCQAMSEPAPAGFFHLVLASEKLKSALHLCVAKNKATIV